ncbi:MAG: RNA-binding transcriptional accessory protein, partial [Duncaniella sp.]|nr:RNA-binding transcriptional accessory protein [Duncaniella sp.]
MANIHANIITKELGSYLRKHVAACLRLLDEGATVPFIARYRKEATGGMDEVIVHAVQERHQALAELDRRKEYIMEVIRGAGALTPELEERITETLDPIVLEDIYLPFKPKRNTRAQAARQ